MIFVFAKNFVVQNIWNLSGFANLYKGFVQRFSKTAFNFLIYKCFKKESASIGTKKVRWTLKTETKNSSLMQWYSISTKTKRL